MVSPRVGLGGVPRSRRGRRGNGSKRLRPGGRNSRIFFFRTEEAFEEWERIALRRCGPRVLDVGAGAGAHALVLQARGHEVTALDLIPEAVRIMRERGVEDAREGTLFQLSPANVYDTVILLMNGSMITETLAGLDRLLAAAASVLEPQGTLILDSTDLRDVGATDADEDEGLESESEWEPGNKSENLPEDDDPYIGELHYQLSVGEQVGDIFPQLFVDPDTLGRRVRLAGWDMEVIWSGPGGRYLARLSKLATSVTDDASGQNHAVSETLA